jgi:2-phosphosulfolactate phosphatase
MRVRVDLLPAGSYSGEVVVLIDALRSCTAAPLLFDRGLETLFMTPSVRTARTAAASTGHRLLGDRGGVPPEGFNHSNSPADLLRLDFSDRTAILVSDNAPAVLGKVDAASEILLGSLYNASAAARLAVELATASGSTIRLVCCGFENQEDLDDTLAAGFLTAEILRFAPGVVLEGAAKFSLSLLQAFPDPVEAFWHSIAGRYLRKLERADDLAVAARVSSSGQVPRLRKSVAGENGEADSGKRLYRFESCRQA